MIVDSRPRGPQSGRPGPGSVRRSPPRGGVRTSRLRRPRAVEGRGEHGWFTTNRKMKYCEWYFSFAPRCDGLGCRVDAKGGIMDSIVFDTHAFVKELTDAGMPEPQAEGLARTHAQADRREARHEAGSEGAGAAAQARPDLAPRLDDGGRARRCRDLREAAAGRWPGAGPPGVPLCRKLPPPAMRGTSSHEDPFPAPPSRRRRPGRNSLRELRT